MLKFGLPAEGSRRRYATSYQAVRCHYRSIFDCTAFISFVVSALTILKKSIDLPRLALAAVCLVRKDQKGAVAAVKECVRTKPDLSREEVMCIVGKELGAGVWAIAEEIL